MACLVAEWQYTAYVGVIKKLWLIVVLPKKAKNNQVWNCAKGYMETTYILGAMLTSNVLKTATFQESARSACLIRLTHLTLQTKCTTSGIVQRPRVAWFARFNTISKPCTKPCTHKFTVRVYLAALTISMATIIYAETKSKLHNVFLVRGKCPLSLATI